MKKIITLILTFILIFTFVACDKTDNNSNVVVSEDDTISSKPVYEGTGNYIFKDGKTDYVIVIPEESNDKENFASTELVNILYESTGIKMTVVTDEDKTYTENSKYISVGDTKLIEDAGITINEDAKQINAFQITTKGKSLFLIGGKEYGVNYSVYEFLNDIVNFEQYYTDCYTLETSVTDIELKKYNVVCKPDIVRTVGSVGFMASDKTIATRMRSPYNYTSVYGSDDEIPFMHTTLYYLPLEKYYANHPDWYNTDKTQLCYTAHGDEDEYNLMLTAYTDRLKQLIKYCAGRDIHEYAFANMDISSSCGCDDCNAKKQEYGTDSGAYIVFVNKASEIIWDWMQNDEEGKEYYDADFRIVLLAYQKFEAAPVTYNKQTQQYEPNSPDVVLGDHVLVQIAPVTPNYTKSIYDEYNVNSLNTIKAWKAISNSGMDFWFYCTNFRHYMYPIDTFNYMVDYRNAVKEVDALAFNDQTQNGNYGGMTGWHILKAYLSSKLCYNTKLNIDMLTDNFFDAYFDVASDTMKEWYYNWRRFALYQQNVLGAYNASSMQYEIANKKYWPKAVIDKWYEYANKALEEIKVYKDVDNDKYNTLYKHIVCERVSIEYMYLTLYSSSLGNKYEQIKANFIEGVNLNNITCQSEGGNMSDFIDSLA